MSTTKNAAPWRSCALFDVINNEFFKHLDYEQKKLYYMLLLFTIISFKKIFFKFFTPKKSPFFPLNSNLGSTDISEIGDGTVTGAISELDSNIESLSVTLGTTSTVYNISSGDITSNTTLYTATSFGFINMSPVIYNGYGEIYIGNTRYMYYSATSNGLFRSNFFGFIKPGETVRIVVTSGSGIRKDAMVQFTPITIS